VRRVSRATTQQGRQFLDVATALEDAWPIFERNAQRGALAVATLPERPPFVEVNERNVCVEATASEPAVLSIIHPPYFNAYRYSSINSFEMAWLGFPPAEVRRNEIREAFKSATREKVSAYLEDIGRSLVHVADTTARGGTVALMIGD